MGRHSAEEEYEDDPEEPDESDMDEGDEGEDLIECPHCGEEIYEHAQKCPECGEYVSDETSRRRTGHPGWVIWTALALLAAILYGWLKLM